MVAILMERNDASSLKIVDKIRLGACFKKYKIKPLPVATTIVSHNFNKTNLTLQF